MSETNQTYLAMVRREHQPVTGFDRAICGRCGAVDRREGYPCAALVLLDALATERARAEAAERDGQRLLTLNAAVAGENARLRAELARTLAAQRMADGEAIIGLLRAALAGAPEGEPAELTLPALPMTEGVGIVVSSGVRPGLVLEAADDTTAPECRDGWHTVRPGESACLCGENRTERLL